MKNVTCFLGFAFCLHFNSFAQLRIKPPKEDTSNTQIARWCASTYKDLLGLNEKQSEEVYYVLLANKNALDSLGSIKGYLTTERLMAISSQLDNKLKTIFTDVQYYDYLRTDDIYYTPKSKK